MSYSKIARIGAGAVDPEDVPDFGLVVGNPGRVIGWICVCGNRISMTGDAGSCDQCKRQYAKKGENLELI